jgi:LAO/AO transport system kinase
MDFIHSILQGDRSALARMLTEIENDTAAGREGLDELFLHTGKAHLIGITGPSGCGKSTLVNALVHHLRTQQPDQKIAVVAVDPTSPFTGGALLGDRVRMRDLALDEGVFVRSMATRGALGGLARNTQAVSMALDAAGYDPILIETVGAGQDEVEIARLAHTTLVVEAPGLGDEVQASKAGIMEIADVLVVNKSDQPGADNLKQALEAMLEMAYADQVNESQGKQNTPAWVPPVLATTALDGRGVPELAGVIGEHKRWLKESREWKKRERVRLSAWVENLFREAAWKRWQEEQSALKVEQAIEQVMERKLSPYQAVEGLLKK